MYTIIIPNYNRTVELKRCLDSIEVAFDGFAFPEIIVVEDNSHTVLEDVRIAKHIILNKNGGPVRARFEGAQYASNDYILLLDSDDTLLEDSIKTIENTKNSNPNYDLYGFIYKGVNCSKNFEIKSIEDYCNFVFSRERVSDYIIFIKKSVFQNFITSHSYRLSEIWFFSMLFINHKGIYSNKAIFNYFQDASEQLSKKRLFKFKCDEYERASVSKSLEYFLKFNSTCINSSHECKEFVRAWKRRLIKEGIFSCNFKVLMGLMCSKNL